MNALSRNMLRALRAYDLDGVLVADFRTVRALLAAGFIQWDSTASAYIPSDLGLEALVDHDEAHAPDPDLLGWLIDAVQAPEDADDEPEPAQAEPVVVAPDYSNTDEPDAYTGWDELEAAPEPAPAEPEAAAEPAQVEAVVAAPPKRRRARRAVTA